ncbi:MAG: GGDEF domain-containing protein, partial [Zoogloea sp.]|nr:GGDEF domain-containing protein [Zoogloea sp.]
TVSLSRTVARMGGDEFTVILPPQEGLVSAGRVPEAIIAALGRPFVIDDKELTLSASIGVAVHPAGGADAEVLLRNADKAMYEAKRHGRGRFCYFDPAAAP